MSCVKCNLSVDTAADMSCLGDNKRKILKGFFLSFTSVKSDVFCFILYWFAHIFHGEHFTKNTINPSKHVVIAHFREQDIKCWFHCISF